MFMYACTCMYVCMYVCMYARLHGICAMLRGFFCFEASGCWRVWYLNFLMYARLCTQYACMDVCVGVWTDECKPWHFMFYHVYVRACMYMWMLAWIPCVLFVLCLGGLFSTANWLAIAEGTSHPETHTTRGGWPPETASDSTWRDLSIHLVTAQENINRPRIVYL
jgi:hypothetical protein